MHGMNIKKLAKSVRFCPSSTLTATRNTNALKINYFSKFLPCRFIHFITNVFYLQCGSSTCHAFFINKRNNMLITECVYSSFWWNVGQTSVCIRQVQQPAMFAEVTVDVLLLRNVRQLLEFPRYNRTLFMEPSRFIFVRIIRLNVQVA